VIRRSLIPIAICAALAGADAASAQTGEALTDPGDNLSSTWAEVNVCSPTQLGARAQLAGDGSESEMSVRFTAEWLSPDGWTPLEGAATSPWQSAGSAEYTWGQAGWTFNISVPPGFTYQLRATAELQWGSGRSETRVTGTCSVGG
jgi:hypothetical protein